MEKTAYSINRHDVCVPGYERLVKNDEFVLSVELHPEMTREDIRDKLLRDIQACERFDHFAHDLMNEVIASW